MGQSEGPRVKLRNPKIIGIEKTIRQMNLQVFKGRSYRARSSTPLQDEAPQESEEEGGDRDDDREEGEEREDNKENEVSKLTHSSKILIYCSCVY